MESENNTVESAKNTAEAAAKNTAEAAKNAADSAKDTAKNVADSAKDAAQAVGDKAEAVGQKVSDAVSKVVPVPAEPPIQAESDVHVLKSRLEWGEPALTILDVRDRMVYNEGHIMGSMPMPIDQLVERAEPTLAKSRDIYVYGENDEQTNQAAQLLRNAGFEHVSALKGGLAAWKAVGGPTEGVVESRTPAGADDYNVVARMQNHAETQNKDV